MCPKHANPAQLTRFDLKSFPCWPQTDATSLRRRHAAFTSATTLDHFDPEALKYESSDELLLE